MSWFSIQHRLIFVHIPKNAGSSINAALSGVIPDYSSFEGANKLLGYERDMALGNHFTYRMIAELVDNNPIELDYAGFFKFCVIRNPWERMVSLYNHRWRKRHALFEGKPRNSPEDNALLEQGFKAWLLNTNHESDRVLTKMPQVEWIKDANGKLAVDLVIPFENVAGGMERVAEKVGLPRIGLSRINVNERSSAALDEYYDGETRAFIERHFAEDIETFKYTYSSRAA